MEAKSTITDHIRLKAGELGFSHIKIARAEPLEIEGNRLTEWLSQGWQASMDWIGRNAEKRADPSKVLKDVQSVICIAMNYFVPMKRSNIPGIGKISRYAAGNDYHVVMTERMEMLLEFIKTEIPKVRGKIYVDTGPVMEKAWAVRSGIGWMGKHTNIITQDYGSWVFLGEILLDERLEYDHSVPDYCGTCTACIDACPTNAIIEPYLLDSNRCISYLTIEHRSELPEKLIPEFQNWIYGCDICQDVCPWNRFGHATEEEEFQPRKENTEPLLTELVKITEQEFNDRFSKSPVKRIKHSGLIRNIRTLLEYAERMT